MARRSRTGLAQLGFGVLIAVSGQTLCGQASATLRVRIENDPLARQALILAIQGAVERLRRVGCRKVVDDFPEWRGGDAVSELEASGVPLTDYAVKYVSFVDGSDSKQCRQGPTLAFTGVGYKVVQVCPARVANVAKDMATFEILMIHEILHTLGLPENPPSSAQITDRVKRRCL